jgi:VWFA-related protein
MKAKTGYTGWSAMKRIEHTAKLLAIGFLSLVAIPGPLWAQQSKPLEEEKPKAVGDAAIRLSVEQVRVDATVSTKDGNLITGLKQDNFEVYEDKVKQEITYFEPVEAPMTAVLVTEYSRALPWEILYDAIMASYSFVDQMRPGDWVAVRAYDMRPETLVDFTQDKGEVLGALQKLNYPAYRESNLYDTVCDTLDRIEEVDQKTAVVLLASGQNTFSHKNLSQVYDRAKRTNAVIYAVSLGQSYRIRNEPYMSGSGNLDLLQGDTMLRTICKSTGGVAFFPRFQAQYREIFSSIAAMLRSQYALGYVSTNPKKDGKFRKINVVVKVDLDGDGKPDKVKVNSREGYIAEKGD